MQPFPNRSRRNAIAAVCPEHQSATLGALVSGCITSRTVTLSHVAGLVPGLTQVASRYRRLQRFFQHARLDGDGVARSIVSMLGLRPPFTPCLDHTNWQIGRTDINFLVLAVAAKKARIPLLWTVLDGCGNSDTAKRVVLLTRFCKVSCFQAAISTIGDPAVCALVSGQAHDEMHVVVHDRHAEVLAFRYLRGAVVLLFGRPSCHARQNCS